MKRGAIVPKLTLAVLLSLGAAHRRPVRGRLSAGSADRLPHDLCAGDLLQRHRLRQLLLRQRGRRHRLHPLPLHPGITPSVPP